MIVDLLWSLKMKRIRRARILLLGVHPEYRGKGVDPGQKSLALRIVMQDTDRTLTDSEVEAVMVSVRDRINEKFQAKPRT